MHVDTDATQQLQRAATAARDATRTLAGAPDAQRNAGLHAMAARLREAAPVILAANAADLGDFSGSSAFRDRLTLTDARIDAMATGVAEIASLPDPLARVLAEWTRPNGLRIRRIAQPLGVIGMIYESRPNVGADAAALCLKSGNAVILRGDRKATAAPPRSTRRCPPACATPGCPRPRCRSHPPSTAPSSPPCSRAPA